MLTALLAMAAAPLVLTFLRYNIDGNIHADDMRCAPCPLSSS